MEELFRQKPALGHNYWLSNTLQKASMFVVPGWFNVKYSFGHALVQMTKNMGALSGSSRTPTLLHAQSTEKGWLSELGSSRSLKIQECVLLSPVTNIHTEQHWVLLQKFHQLQLQLNIHSSSLMSLDKEGEALQEVRSPAFCLSSIKIALFTSSYRLIPSLKFLCKMSL